MSENLEAEVEYEFDDEGRSTGVEREELDDLIHEPFDPADIDVQTRTMTVDLLLSRQTISVATSDVVKVRRRFSAIEQMLREVAA